MTKRRKEKKETPRKKTVPNCNRNRRIYQGMRIGAQLLPYKAQELVLFLNT